jgi:hypothetical protein
MADVKSTPSLTPAQQIRLESVSLAYRHDRSTEDVIKRAEDLAKFVEGKQAAAKPGKPGKAANGEQVEPESDLI